MALRTGHGNGAGEPRVEVLPADELPPPLPDVAEPLNFRDGHKIADSDTAKALGARGGRKKAERAKQNASRTALVAALGLKELAADSAFAAYRDAGNAFIASHVLELAKQAGGSLGPGPSSIVASAGMQLAASRFFADKAAEAGDPALFHLASSLANASRQNLLAAYELAVREGAARSSKDRDAHLYQKGGG